MSTALTDLERILGETPLRLGGKRALLTALRDVAAERERQDMKWHDAGCQLDLLLFLAVLGEEKGEVDRAALELRGTMLDGLDQDAIELRVASLREELIQVAAVAVKIVEAIDTGRLVVDVPPGDLPRPAEALAAP